MRKIIIKTALLLAPALLASKAAFALPETGGSYTLNESAAAAAGIARALSLFEHQNPPAPSVPPVTTRPGSANTGTVYRIMDKLEEIYRNQDTLVEAGKRSKTAATAVKAGAKALQTGYTFQRTASHRKNRPRRTAGPEIRDLRENPAV